MPLGYEGEIPPDRVPGYSQAVESGVIRLPPLEPPSRIPGYSALAAFWLFLAVAVITGGLWWILVNLLNTYGGLVGVWRLLLILPGLVWFLGLLWGLRRVGTRLYAELEAGYATLPLLTGGFSIGDGRAFGLSRVRGPWNFRGVWILDGRGNVKSGPDRSVMPPGFYPSPHRQGQLELWSGTVWMGEYK